jgi:Leucine-rich repeat (LRR) protein
MSVGLLFILPLYAYASSPWPQLNDELFLKPESLPLPSYSGRYLLSSLDTSYPNPPSEILALQSLYSSLTGQYWSWSTNSTLGRVWDFNFSQPCTDNWQRISCVCVPAYGLCFVVSLDLSNFNLEGTISSNIKYLSQLAYLNLAINPLLRGRIPSEIGTLTNLIYLSMYLSHITGTIPDEIQNLQALQYLILGKIIDFNIPIQLVQSRNESISGPYPAMLSSLSSLRYLYLYGTQQEGTIPSAWSTMTQLNALVLGGTFLNGTLPSSIFSLVNLVYFVVGASKMTGTIPSEIGNLVNCQVFAGNRNSFTSTLPETISRLTSLEFFYAYDNALTGPYPVAVNSLEKLKYLYLSYNQLTGSIPREITRLSELQLLSLEYNSFHSSLPSELGLLPALQFLDLSMNSFSGSVPSHVGLLSSLEILNLTVNRFSGSLDFLQKLSRLKSLDLSANSFLGSLPTALSLFTSMEYFQLWGNQITGPVPTWLGALQSLICLDLSANLLTGSLPSEVSKLQALVYLDLSFNSLSSSLPKELSSLSSLQYLILEECRLSGALPEDIGRLLSMRSLRLARNRLTGPLPNSIGSLSSLQILDLSRNRFSGSLPPTMGLLPSLKYLLLPANRFHGSLEPLIGPEFGSLILTIDISDNAFTGTLPADIFAFPSLQHFAAAVNCLHGSLQLFMCDAQELEVLALDGVGAAVDCQLDYFPWTNSYGLLNGIHGSLPSCLFEMSKLKTLHLSGNLISGSLPNRLNISTRLEDISLSHNLFTGSIPLKIQEREWRNLDLSFNKFYGSLSSKFASYPPSSSLRLLVNRLSGKVPVSVQRAYNVSVLDGNLFECDVYNGDKGLPKHDSATGVYQCADSFQQLSYTWMSPYLFFVLLAFAGLTVFTVWKSWSEKVYRFAESIDKSMVILDKQFGGTGRTSSILLFKKFLVDWQVTCVFISVCNLLVILPIWVVLTIYYNTYQFEYSWSASVAYLSGLVPSLVALVVFTLLLATVFSLSTTNSARHKSRRTSNFVAVELPESLQLRLSHYGTLLVIATFNFVIVVGVNVLYVLATNNFNKTVVTMCALAVALFKFVWNLVILAIFEALDRRLAKLVPPNALLRCQQRNLITQSVIGLINNILIPLLSTAGVSSTCYYYFFQTAPPIVASFDYSECVVQTVLVYTCQVLESVTVCNNVEGLTYQCLGERAVQKTTSFFPPFNYSYQCSSTFIASYAAVYVYTYMVVALISPLAISLLLRLRQALPQQSSLRRSLTSLLPQYIVPVEEGREEGKRLFNKNFFVTSAITDTAVLITFGAVFPPLSFVICVAIMIRAFLILFMIGKLLCAAEERSLPEYSRQLLQDCADIPETFGKLLWLILPFAALIFSLFILDTYGDAVSWRGALIPTAAMCSVPLLFLLLRRVYVHPAVKPGADRFFDWCRDNIPLAKLLLKSRPKDLGLRATTIVSESARLSTVAFRSTVVGVLPHAVRTQPSEAPRSVGKSVKKVTPMDDQEGERRGEGGRISPSKEKDDDRRPPMKVLSDMDIEEL